jgi:hypothetical protein
MAVGPWASVFDERSDANRAGQSGSHSVPEVAVRRLRMKRARLADWSTSSATLGQKAAAEERFRPPAEPASVSNSTQAPFSRQLLSSIFRDRLARFSAPS